MSLPGVSFGLVLVRAIGSAPSNIEISIGLDLNLFCFLLFRVILVGSLWPMTRLSATRLSATCLSAIWLYLGSLTLLYEP